MNEQWKDVVGYEGIYQVSDHGRVKRVARGPSTYPGRILSPTHNSSGYVIVPLCQGGKQVGKCVHRLVAEAFLGPAPSPKHEANHKDGNKDDNHAKNLEWLTCSENTKHAYRVLGIEPRRGERSGMSKLTRCDVRRIRMLYATGEYTQAELGDMFGVARDTIGHIIRRETWQHVA